jgi:hypothetical protein
VQLIARGFVLQRADLIHHKTPDLMAGSITGQPRPLGPERGIELRLTPMQPDQMLGHMPEIFLVHEYTCLRLGPAGEQV